jgi:hypothetical protein
MVICFVRRLRPSHRLHQTVIDDDAVVRSTSLTTNDITSTLTEREMQYSNRDNG